MIKKTSAFTLFTVIFAIGIACFGLCLYMGENFFYTMDSRSAVERILYGRAMTKARIVRDYINRGDLAGAKAYCDDSNFDVEIWLSSQWNEGDGDPIWSSFDGEQGRTYKEGFAQISEVMGFYNQKPVTIGEHTLNIWKEYLFFVYIDLDFPIDDDLKPVGEGALMLYGAR